MFPKRNEGERTHLVEEGGFGKQDERHQHENRKCLLSTGFTNSLSLPSGSRTKRQWIILTRRVALGIIGFLLLIVATLAMIFFLFGGAEQEINYSKMKSGENLIFLENFDTLNRTLWNVEQTMNGGGNGEFQLYVDRPETIFVKEGILNIKPGLFQDLPPMQTVPDDDTEYQAIDVMTGNCSPYPACATYAVGPGCSDARWGGCGPRAGAPGAVLPPAVSGRLNTAGAFAFQYGRAEFRARLPAGDWLWPALWLLPAGEELGGAGGDTGTGRYGPWPASGEIDVAESRGNPATYWPGGYPQGRNVVGSTLHYGNLQGNGLLVDGWPNAHGVRVKTEDSFADEFLTYGLYWDKNRMYTYVLDQKDENKEHVILDITAEKIRNGFWNPPLGGSGVDGRWQENPYQGQATNAPFDQPFYLILNVAVGGTWYFGGETPWSHCYTQGCDLKTAFWEGRGQWLPSWEEAGDKLAMQVDWIKVWQLDEMKLKQKT